MLTIRDLDDIVYLVQDKIMALTEKAIDDIEAKEEIADYRTLMEKVLQMRKDAHRDNRTN